MNTGDDKSKTKTTVIRIFPAAESVPASSEVYLVWCSKEDVIFCACVELFGIEAGDLSVTTALLDTVVRGCMMTLAHPVMDKCIRLLKRRTE